MKHTLISIALIGAACGDNSSNRPPSTDIECAGEASGTPSPQSPVTVSGTASRDLAGAALGVEAATTVPPDPVTLACANDIVPAGFIALGPAVAIGPESLRSDRSFKITLPYKAARLPSGASRRHVRVVAKRVGNNPSAFFPPISNRDLDDEDSFASRISFRAHELTTYQVVAAENAGQTVMRRYTYRAIAGISMGGSAALGLGLRNHEKFDLIVDLGGEPGPSMKYSVAMFSDYVLGGFCSVADQAAGVGNIGSLCLDSQRPARTAEHERKSNYEAFLYEAGGGVGLTLKRSLYIKASRDLSRAFGNPAHFSPDNAYLPPGIDSEWPTLPAADRCDNPIVLSGFFDAEFNPDGKNSVITFCDGVDSENLGLGVFDPALEQNSPTEILLAVDLNGNKVRDSGEPVITNGYEPFDDIGSDGIADTEETGPLGSYDATTNPDPAGDNYDSLVNPLGTEGNGYRDQGEPFADVGLDGVANTCQIGETAPDAGDGCFDFGEGDGSWTISPNLLRWYQNDVDVLLGNMSPEDRSRINIWHDAGIRDFLNAQVSTNAGVATMMAKYQLAGAIYDQFGPLIGKPNDAGFDFFAVPFQDIPRNVYVRYGDPDASAAVIESGDGRHVGTVAQVVNRVTTSFRWLQSQWPNGDRDDVMGSGSIESDLMFTPSSGRETPFALFLPPGYHRPENANRRYPVIYFLHGYGQDPSDLVSLSGIFESYMTNRSVAQEDRFAKFIMVYVDGRCRPNQTGVPVPEGGDGCEGGTFYLDSPLGGPAQMEANMLELIDFIDANYRTKTAEQVEVTP